EFTIANNNALSPNAAHEGKGGGVFVGDGGQIVYTGTGNLYLKNNRGSAGGGIYTELGYTLQVPAYISGNYASGKGGGVYAEKYFSLKDGSDISGNTAQDAGGGIYVGNKGTLGSSDKNFVLHGNSQIMNNLSGGETGGGVFVEAGRSFVIHTQKISEDGTTFGGGDVWFEGNYAKVGFDPDGLREPEKDNAFRNAIHLSNTATDKIGGPYDPATLEISGPYNTYFYDAISGDVGTMVTIMGVPAEPGVNTVAAHNVTAGQRGTVIFHADSEFYGDTEVVYFHKNVDDEWVGGATFRLENNSEGGAIYGRRGSQEGTNNTFTLGTDSWITGQGTIAADSIVLSGNLNLDTGTFTQPGRPDKVGDPAKDPPGRDGSGVVKDTGTGQGILNLDGDVTIADTSNWLLTLGTGGTTDRVDVTGKADFTGGTVGEKIRFDIDDLIRGKYLVLTASDGFKDTYNTDKQKSDAEIYLGLNNLATNDPLTVLSDPVFGRVKATSYVDTNGTDLYLDLGGRNRHVTLTANSNWGYDDAWTFDTTGPIPIPTGTVGAGNWEENDLGPATNVYLDGDMVTISGALAARTVTLTTPVRPVDLFVDGTNNVTITGTSGITTFSTTGTGAYGPRGTTIKPVGAIEVNDYSISYYTGKLHKSEANTLTFSNTAANLFTEGIEFNVGGGNAGVISFSNVNQLTVGTGKYIDFLENGTLRLNLAGTSGTLRTSASEGTNIRIADTKTATFDILANALTVSGVISNYSGNGAIEKTGVGTLVLSGTNTFTGGTTFRDGKIEIRNAKALGTYTVSEGAAGSVYVKEDVTKNLLVNNNYTIQNRFDVSGGTAANVLSIDIASSRTLTIDNSGISTLADGGAIYVDSGQGQLTFGNSPTYGGALIVQNNRAQRGGGIYSGVDSLLTFRGATTFLSNEATVGSGGGLYNAGAVTFNDTATIQSNTARLNGGGIYTAGAVTFNAATTIQNNAATDGSGGGVHAAGDVVLNNNGTFTLGGAGSLGNTADLNGGGIYSGGNVALTGTGIKTIAGNESTSGSGGGIRANLNVNIAGTTDLGEVATAGTGNKANVDGGGIYAGGTATFGTLNAYRNVAETGSGGAIYAVGNVSAGATTLGGTTAGTGSTAGAYGGAIYTDGTATFTSLTAYNNTAMTGGAVYAGTGITVNGAVTLGTATSRNTASVDGGALYSDGNVTLGGAVSLVGNTATTGSGGGIWAEDGTVSLTGTGAKTITGNTATAGWGGAVYAHNINLSVNTATTISGNQAAYGGAFAIADAAGAGTAGTLTLNTNIGAAGGNITFSGNTATSGSAIYLGNYGNIDITATSPYMVWFNSNTLVSDTTTDHTLNKSGTGLLAFTGAGTNNIFQGTTNVNAGEFRVAQGTAYGHNAVGTSFKLDDAAALTGGGTLKSELFEIFGMVAPDRNTGATFWANIPVADQVGTLTFDGDVIMYGGSSPYQYEAHLEAKTSVGDPDAWKTTGLSDLLSVKGTFYAEIGTDLTEDNPEKIIINVHNFGVGKYLLIEATDLLVTRNGAVQPIEAGDLDGLGVPGAFTLLIHETEKTNRHLVFFLRGNEEIFASKVVEADTDCVYANDAYHKYVKDNDIDPEHPPVGDDTYDELLAKAQNELWLATQTYNLHMWWTGKNDGDGAANLWQGTESEANGNWREEMSFSSLEPETHFMHADSVVFAETYPGYSGIIGFEDDGPIGRRDIEIEATGVRVTNMIVDNVAGAGKTYSFSGGGITTTAYYAGDELDDLLGYVSGAAPQQLVKRGDGTLTFNNVLTAGSNTFSGGIVFETSPGSDAGIISFNRANQLGDGGRGITFNENGVLRADAAIASLTNNLHIADGKTATFNTNGYNVTHTGKIDEIGIGDTGNFIKTGTGTLTLNNASSGWQGTTSISAGTLTAVGVGAIDGTGSLGMNTAGRTITFTAAGTNLTLQIAGTETLKQRITGAGSLTKTDTGTLTLDRNDNNYSGGTTISSGRIIAEKLNAVGTGTITTAANTVLELKLETADGGTFSPQITGSGKLVKSGGTPSTLTLSRSDNNYSGGTDITSGRITVTNVGAVGSNVAAGTVNMETGSSLEFALTASGTFNQSITGAGQLIKTGSTTVTLTNTNPFTGGIFFEASGGDAGTIAFNSANNLGADGNVITFNENGMLQANAAIPGTAPLTNELKIADGKTATFNTNTFNVTLSGKIDDIASSDEGKFTKTGAGTLTLTNTSNNWHGDTTISAGTLQADGVGTLGWNDIAHEVAIAGGAFLNLNIASGTETLHQWITGLGTVQKSGAGELIFDQVDNTYSGGTTIATGMLTVKHAEHEILSVSQNGGLGIGNVVINAAGANTGLNFDIEEDGTFSKIISGAGMVTKSGNETLTLSGASTYTGATNINGGKVIITNMAGTGDNTAARTVSLAAGTELEIQVAGTYNKKITGAGELTTNHSGTITLTNANDFTGGTTQKQGTLQLNNVAALGTYTTPGGKAGELDVTGNAITTLNVAGAYQNRFVVDTGLTWTLNGSVNSTISGVQSGQNGGAVYLGAGSTANMANTGAWTFTGNTGTGGVANDIYLNNAALNFTSTGSQFFNSGIAGTGTISKTSTGIVQIAENSAFDGATTVSAGTFRVVDNKTFGTGIAGSAFTLDGSGTLAGQGTIKAEEIFLASTLSPDSAKFAAGGSTAIPTANRFGTITLDGKVDLASTFKFNYNAGTPIASNTITPIGYDTPTGDLIKMQNGGAGNYNIATGATVNFVDTLISGKYLIFTADQDFTLDGPTLDGIKAGGVVKATIASADNHTPRGGFEFTWGTSDTGNDIESQIWLNVNRNTLEMTWKDAPDNSIWVSANGGANFLSTQSYNDGGTPIYEQMFNDGDYAIFNTKTTARTITIGNPIDTDGVIVSGMKVDATSNYTFDGDGITAYATHPTIEGDYIPGGVHHGTTPVNPDGKLQKSGTGTLTFANSGNQFTKGIEISNGVLAFSNANQLNTLDTDDTTDNAITFVGTSTLQANATGQNLANKIIINAGQTANINTQAHTLTLSGLISGNALTKSAGTGTLNLTNTANDYTGITTVSAGTLRVSGDASGTALGSNTASLTHYVAVASGAKLELTVTSGVQSTLEQQITGAGTVEKTGAGEQILVHTNNTYTGNTTVATGTLTGYNVGSFGANTAANFIDIKEDAALKFDMDATGTANYKLTGAGELVKTQHGGGADDLILDNIANDFTGNITVTGGTAALPNYLVTNDSRSLGAIDDENRTIEMVSWYDYLRINETAPGNTIANKIIGAGQLSKYGSETTTLSGDNTFTGGTNLRGGAILLGSDTALGTYTGSSGTEGVLFYRTNDTKVLSTTAGRTITNQFVVFNGVTGTKLEAAADLTLQQTTGANAVVEVGNNAGMTVDANGGNITFAPHATNTAPDIMMATGTSSLTLNTTNAANGIFINSGISGQGTITKTGLGIAQIAADSNFNGATSVDAGMFRVVGNNTYGGAAATAFTLNSGATLAGQGTVRAGTIDVHGFLSPDSDTLSATKSTIDNAHQFGTLTFDGLVTFDNFTMIYSYDTESYMALPSKDETTHGINTGDLLRVLGPDSPLIKSGTIDMQAVSLNTGWYLIAESETPFDLEDEDLDGITGSGVLHLTRFGESVNTDSPRNWYEFEFGKNADGIADARIWLRADTNSLVMDWQMGGNGKWEADSMYELNWQSVQANIGPIPHSYRFRRGDYVRFEVTGDSEIEIVHDNTIVSGFEVDGDFGTTFTGTGGVHAKKEDSTWIIGKYLPGGLGYKDGEELDPTGKLQKFGSGMLTFENTGGNLFDEGIEIAAGTVGFNNGNQLQVGSGKLITFTGAAVDNAKLQANADTTLATNIVAGAGKEGTIDTLTNKLTHTGSIAANGTFGLATAANGFLFQDGAVSGTGTVTKTGVGTAQISTDSTFSGTTSVDAGTFRVVQNKSYGTTGSGSFTVGANGTIAGGGTIKAAAVTISGTISADSGTLDAVHLYVENDKRFGILTFDGATTFDGFTMLYDADLDLVKTSKIPDTDINTGDLLRILGTDSPLLKGGTIDVQADSLETGWYLIAESTTAFSTEGGAPLDGINVAGGVLNLTLNGSTLAAFTPRTLFEFSYGYNDTVEDGRVWLHADTNSLTMDWNIGSGTWDTAAKNWKSQQDNAGVHEERFRRGDYVRFDVTADSEIEIADNFIVSGINVDGAFNTTFIGNNGIHAKTEDSALIIGKYLPGGVGTPTLIPDGKLQKFGSGMLTFENTGGNLFDKGIEIAEGTVGFNDGNQLQVGSGKLITFTGAAMNNAKLQANDTAVLAADIAVTTGSKGTVDTQTHKLTHTGSIAANGTIELATAADGFLFQDGAISGTGTVTKTGVGTAQISTDSTFSGTTSVDAGTFRVVQSKSYGTTGSGSFTVGANGTIAGGGTIKAAAAAISGTISADSGTLDAAHLSVENDKRFGVLTFDANTTLDNGFRMEYDAQTDIDAVPRGDLLKVINGKTLHFGTGTINLINADSRLTGQYLIMEADGKILHTLDADPDKLLTANINSNPMTSLSVRGRYIFFQKDKATGEINLDGNQIWLDVEKNSLNMVWQDSAVDNIWTTVGGAENWLSKQGPPGEKERVFLNGDYVHFLGSTEKSIEVVGGIIVSGFEMDADADYTFAGTGTIDAYETHVTIEGKYLPGAGGTPMLMPDGKLNKKGTGVLAFQNNANTFHEGIEITAGTLAFNNANQLGDGGNGITFLGNAVLRSDADIPSLTNSVKLSNLVTAVFNTNGFNMMLDGKIEEIAGTANVVKDGQGILSLTNTANSWDGMTTVKAGTLQAVGVETLGTNSASRTIIAEKDAELELKIDSASPETLAQKITGAGSVDKTGLQTLVLTNDNNYTGGTTISAGKIVAETLIAVGDNAASGIVTMETNTALELKLESGEGGTFFQQITGGGKLVKSGGTASTLTLSRSDNNYTGGTDINSGRIQITDVGAVGSNVAAGTVNINGTDSSLEVALTADDTFNQLIAGSGQLIKTANTAATLTNVNTFTGGTELAGGTLILDNALALNKTEAIAGSKQGFVFVTSDAAVSAGNGVSEIQNRFEVSADKLLTIDSLNITDNDIRGVNGGAIELGAGAGFVSIDKLDLHSNKTDLSGGAIYAPNEIIFVGGAEPKNTVNSLVDNSAGEDGGAIYAAAVNVIGGQTISGNTAGGHGGALYLVGGTVPSTLDAAGCDINLTGNRDSSGSNAIYMSENVTLNLIGNKNIYLDGISSKGPITNGNLIDISMQHNDDMGNVVSLSEDSLYYG
ncbi:MAG: autotransporter-associated beta strand repeat-containing protein, partial [Planctomycetaceae bacterium]|nr:autotransporter-associated beta strand repeat-containing protein [Planctomycetaceae bacterium]